MARQCYGVHQGILAILNLPMLFFKKANVDGGSCLLFERNHNLLKFTYTKPDGVEEAGLIATL